MAFHISLLQVVLLSPFSMRKKWLPGVTDFHSEGISWIFVDHRSVDNYFVSFQSFENSYYCLMAFHVYDYFYNQLYIEKLYFYISFTVFSLFLYLKTLVFHVSMCVCFCVCVFPDHAGGKQFVGVSLNRVGCRNWILGIGLTRVFTVWSTVQSSTLIYLGLKNFLMFLLLVYYSNMIQIFRYLQYWFR